MIINCPFSASINGIAVNQRLKGFLPSNLDFKMPGLLETLHRLLDLVSVSSIKLIGEVYPPIPAQNWFFWLKSLSASPFGSQVASWICCCLYYFITKVCAGTVKLVPLDAEGQRLYSKLLAGDQTCHCLSKAEPGQGAEKTHFGHL